MAGRYVVNAFWDDDAQVWVALSDDIPGLALEARTYSFLRELVDELAPELLEDNCPHLAPLRLSEIVMQVIPEPPLD